MATLRFTGRPLIIEMIALVIVIAAAAAITGDNVGYLIGRKGGRALLEKPLEAESGRSFA